MPSETSDPTTAVPPIGPSAPPGLRLHLDSTMAGTGAVDGGWWPRSRDPDAELPGLIAALLVVPPEATGEAAGIAMAMAADAANNARPALV